MIYRTAAFFRTGRIISYSLIAGAWFAVAQAGAFAAGSVTVAWQPNTDANVMGYNVYIGGASGVYTNTISVASATNAVVSGLVQGANYYFAVTAYDDSGLESPFSNEASYAVPLDVANQPPTLDPLGNLALNQNAGAQTVNLSGISSGAASEIQTLTVTAVSSNPALIPTPAVSYGSANTTGTLTFAPASNASGTATITVTVNDGQAQNNTVTRTFTVTVNAANNPPTLNALGNLALNQNAGAQTVNLSGISSGAASEIQTLTVTAVSSNPALIPTPAVSYGSANTTGTLTFAPASNASGTATITVTVNDGQAQNNTVTRTFTVTVNAVNPPPTLNPISNFYLTKNAAAQTVNLSGISSGAAKISSVAARKKQTIKITAVSGNGKLLPKPTVRYSAGSSAATLTFKPAKNATGTTTITVTVNNGAKINNITQTTFTVTVLAAGQATPATLTPAAHVNGQFALTIAGSSGLKYIVQASTDMVNWIPVQTNAAPFIYTDTQAGQFSQRFYRTVSAP